MTKPVVLCILDGVGYSEEKKHNAVALAKMPFFKGLIKKYPNSLLRASGTAVGLPGNLWVIPKSDIFVLVQDALLCNICYVLRVKTGRKMPH